MDLDFYHIASNLYLIFALMPDFSKRSSQKELLDRDNIPFEAIKQNMRELDLINTYLGGHRITIAGIKQLLQGSLNQRQKVACQHKLHICEIGCGGGDNLRVIKHWCEKNRIDAVYTGIDVNPHCITYAHSRQENDGIEFLCSDYSVATFETNPSIIFSSLFSHHFSNEALLHQFQWMKQNASLGFFINDLHRNPVAYYSISILTKLFSKSYLVKNDAPLSVLRGFKKRELTEILSQLFIHNYQLKWKWAFRWLLVYKHES